MSIGKIFMSVEKYTTSIREAQDMMLLILLARASTLTLLFNLSGQSHADLSYASGSGVLVYFSIGIKITFTVHPTAFVI